MTDLAEPTDFSHLLRGASIETATRDLNEIATYPTLLSPGTDVYIAWLPTYTAKQIVSVAKRVHLAGLNPVPHIAVRRLTNEAYTDDFLRRLAGEVNVRQALVIAGDAPRAAGPYESSSDLLRSGLLQRHGVLRVGLGAHPEGNPRVPGLDLDQLLSDKLALALRYGLDPFIVSQFCFDPPAIAEWLARMRRIGIDREIRIGLAGYSSVQSLLGYAVRCGIGASIRALKTDPMSLTRLSSRVTPDEMVRSLAARLGPAHRPERIRMHFFPFGGFIQTARWLAAAQQPIRA